MWVNTVVDVGGYCGAVLWGGIVGGYEICNVSMSVFFTVLIEKKSVFYFISEIFDSDARFGSSLKIYLENPSS